jgi:hypothetical protein
MTNSNIPTVLLRSLARFNPRQDLLFDRIVAGAWHGFAAGRGAASQKKKRLDDVLTEIQAQIKTAQSRRNQNEVRRLKDIRCVLRARPVRGGPPQIQPRSYKFDVWRTAILGLALAYARGTHKKPSWSNDWLQEEGQSFQAMVSAFRKNAEPCRRHSLRRIASDVLTAHSTEIDEILVRVQRPQDFRDPNQIYAAVAQTSD